MAEEIDIITLTNNVFSAIGRFFKEVGKNILYFIRFSYRNLMLLTIFLFIGIAVGVVFSQLNKTYKSDFTLKFNVSNANTFYDLTQSLDAEVISDQSLAERLNLSDSIADAIKEIEPRYIIDIMNNGTPDYVDEDGTFVEQDTITVKMQDRLNIAVSTKRLYSFPKIQDGLVYFFTNNETFRAEKEIRKQQLRQSIKFINNELDRLSKLSDFEYFNARKQISLTIDSTALLVGEKPRQLYHGDMNKLLLKRDSLEKLMLFSDEVVTVIKPFVPTKKNEYNIIKVSIIFGGIFLLIGYIVAAFRKYRKDISGFLNS
jgi:hypothetical protein